MFSAGDFICSSTDGHFHVLQVLHVSDQYLVKDFWETPTMAADELEIRAWVKRMETTSVNQYEFFKHEPLTEKDQVELERFLEIEKGLNHRKQRTAAMATLVETAMRNGDLNQALDLLTEWAMLEKYRPEIYLMRENCLRKLGRNAEADYERHVYDTISNNKL